MENRKKQPELRIQNSVPEEEPDILGLDPAELKDYLARL